MYSSSYKARSGAVKAFEDAYAKEAFFKNQSSDIKGCTPCFAKPAEEKSLQNSETSLQEKRPPSEPCKPKKEGSGLLSGMDGGDLLLVLLILFFLSDKDSENDGMIPVLLALILLF